MKQKIFMIANDRGEFYRNFQKRSYSKSSCWTTNQKKASVFFEKRFAECAIKHIDTKHMNSVYILGKEIELPSIDDVCVRYDFANI